MNDLKLGNHIKSFWKVTGVFLLSILLWQFSNIINAFAKLIEVLK